MNYLTVIFMSRSIVKVLAVCAVIVVFSCLVYGAGKQKRIGIFCIGDSIVLGNKGAYVYSDILQLLFDKEYGSGKVSVYNYSFFDMNTSQCLKLAGDLLSAPDNKTEFIVIMAGEANHYNLNGYTDYLSSQGLYVPQSAFIEGSDIDSVKKLNTGVASMYNSPAAYSDKACLQYAFSAAYRSIAGSSPKKIGGYVPKIIPSFMILAQEDAEKPIPAASFKTKYKLVWDFAGSQKYKEAQNLLKEMLRGRPLDSSLYYALGSVYLADKSGSGVNEALKMFEEGILVNPFDKSNQCYKGLSVIYMSYDGKIISEVLYFSRVLKSYLGELIPEINSITALNTADYDVKVRMINEWVLSDIKKMDELCKSKGARLLVADYPLNSKVGAFLRNALSFGNITFIESKADEGGDGPPPDSSSIYAETAKNVMEAINKQIKK